jgi:glycerol-3-phosphate dehydrogenase
MASADTQVAVIGGGIVGCAVAHALTRRGVSALLLESEPALALGASGSNSGILHTGFDSTPGELETQLILRSAVLRDELADELGIALWRCGARLHATTDHERATVLRLADNARANGVEVHLDEGSLAIPGEAVTDPVAFTNALAGAAAAGGATLRLGARVTGLASAAGKRLVIGLASGEEVVVRAAINCAGLHADAVALMAEDNPVTVYPRKGEFLVFAAPADESLRQILLPVPSALGKGVLVFPTIDGQIIAGPTAREREDKFDWSVEADAAELIVPRAVAMYPPLAHARQIGAYAGLRPAGRQRSYVIEPSRRLPGLVHAAAIRSTGLSASLGIGEYVAAMLARQGAIGLEPARPLPTPPPQPTTGSWWQRAAAYHADPSTPAAPVSTER